MSTTTNSDSEVEMISRTKSVVDVRTCPLKAYTKQNDIYVNVGEGSKRYPNNWTPKIEHQLNELRLKQKKYIWANNWRSSYFKRWNNRYNVLSVVVSGISSIILTYLTAIGNTPELTALGVVSSVISYFLFVISNIHAYYGPEEKIANHDSAAVSFSDSLYNIERQLTIPIDLREQGDVLYGWVTREFITLIGNTPKIYKNWLDKYDENCDINPENEGTFYSSKCKMDVPFIV